MLVDTHCHLDDPRYDANREEILKQARDSGVRAFITIGCDLKTTQNAQNVALAHPDIFFSAGIHPHEAQKAPADFEIELEKLARHEKCVAIGECGLDFYYDHSPRDIQRGVFLKQIELARKLAKPLVIHVRDAWDECVEILKEQKLTTPVVIHCFTGTLAHAKKFLDIGCYLSISGIITFKTPGELPDVVRQIPLDRLLIETDAPYLAPIPHRGRPNEPAFVKLVAQKIAEFRGATESTIGLATTENAMRVFALLL